MDPNPTPGIEVEPEATEEFTPEFDLSLPETETPPENNPLPTYMTEEQFQTQLAREREEIRKEFAQRNEPRTEPAKEPVDNRTAYEIAEAEGEENGWDYSRILRRASQIERDERAKIKEEAKQEVMQGLAPILRKNAIEMAVSDIAAGDPDTSAQLSQLVASEVVPAEYLGDPRLAKAFKELAELKAGTAKTSPQAARVPGAAPTGRVAPVGGLRGRLTPVQKQALAQYERDNGTYSDEMIAEEFGL